MASEVWSDDSTEFFDFILRNDHNCDQRIQNTANKAKERADIPQPWRSNT